MAAARPIYMPTADEEILAAQLRFSPGRIHPDHPLHVQPYGPGLYPGVGQSYALVDGDGSVYLDFPSAACLGDEASKACIAEWFPDEADAAAGDGIPAGGRGGWFPAVNLTGGAVEGSPHYPWCPYPCMADRPYTGDDPADNMVTGNYAKAWLKRKLETSGQDEFILMDDPANPEKVTSFKKDTPVVQSAVEEFNTYCCKGAGVNSAALILAVLVLGTGSANVFTRDQDAGGLSYQYRTVMHSYVYWLRWVILLMVMLTGYGILLFGFAMKSLVYVKWTDGYVEEHGTFPVWLSAGPESPYGYVQTTTVYFLYAPLALCVLILSFGHAALHTYPLHSQNDLNGTATRTGEFSLDDLKCWGKKQQDEQLVERRGAHADDLVDLLHFMCGLNKTPKDPLAQNYGPRETACFCREGNGIKDERGIFLSGAGGVPNSDAEVVADCLLDAGFHNVRSLVKIVLPTELGGVGHGDKLMEVPGMQRGAGFYAIKGITSFAIGSAFTFVDDESSATDGNLEDLVIPTFLYTYIKKQLATKGTIPGAAGVSQHKEVLRYRAFLYNAKGEKGDDGWRWNEGKDTAHAFYHKPVTCYKRSGLLNQMCLDAVIAWWMVFLDDKLMPAGTYKKSHVPFPKTDDHKRDQANFTGDRKMRMRIPDAQLFPSEHSAVLTWLMEPHGESEDNALLDFDPTKSRFNIPKWSPWDKDFNSFHCFGKRKEGDFSKTDRYYIDSKDNSVKIAN